MIDRRSIGDMTLREIKERCNGDCAECNTFGQNLCSKLFSNNYPCEWDLRQLTDAEIENIKAIHRLMPESEFICKGEDGECVWLISSRRRPIRLAFNEFPSLQPGDEINIGEVLRNETI